MDDLQRPTLTLEQLRAQVGAAPTHSLWHMIAQDQISDFARITSDHAFIHTDPERAARTRFGGTIAHGLLTLSLLPVMMHEATPEVAGTRMGVNYGFDRIRFVAPVPVGARVRGAFSLAELEEREPGFYIFSYDVTVEIKGAGRPALTARWLLGRWIRG
ncbi:MAG TPA: MaoC family dehydratase [Ramlibacter sp.]|nr:MaoC family dehydratase [Ramlibacter sp.]